MGMMKRLFETIESSHDNSKIRLKVMREVTEALNEEKYFEDLCKESQEALTIYASENGLTLSTIVRFMDREENAPNWAEYPDHEYPKQEQ